jgi:hypothetical protein
MSSNTKSCCCRITHASGTCWYEMDEEYIRSFSPVNNSPVTDNEWTPVVNKKQKRNNKGTKW